MTRLDETGGWACVYGLGGRVCTGMSTEEWLEMLDEPRNKFDKPVLSQLDTDEQYNRLETGSQIER